MPLFEYDCAECKQTVEILVRGGERPICPECASENLAKRLSVPAPPTGSRAADFPVSGCQSSGPPCGPICSRFGK